MSSPTDLAGRVALVTGASSGIGRAIVEAFADEGMHVVTCARRRDRLEEHARALAGRKGSVHPVACDLRSETDIAALFAEVRKVHGGRLDVLVNNAGLGRDAPMSSGRTECWREMLELNVLALAICTREALGLMRSDAGDATDAGHIIHVSSMSAYRVAGPAGAMYSATKAAVRHLTEGLRVELRSLGSKIRVTALSPGFVETEFAETFHHGDSERGRQTYSHYEVLQPADIAQAALYALRQPPHVQIHDILMRPTDQPS